MLPRHRERLTAGGNHAHARRGPDDLGHELSGCSEQMLAVVHFQQQLLVLQVRKQESHGLARGLVPQVQRRHDGVADECRLQHLGELNQPSAAAEAAAEICRGPDGQARLADPARPDEADQACLGELLPDFRDLAAAPADKAARLGWKVARAPGRSGHDRY
jgi:hypothetical protein